MRARTFILIALIAFAAPTGAWPQAGAGADALPRLHTNEQDIAEAMRPAALAIDDPLAVFAYVLGRLPERVHVYPTENYYYFRFVHGGVPYSGNIRLAADSRDRGEVNFAYGEEPSDWNMAPDDRYAALGPSQGVTVEKVEPLLYRVSFRGKSVLFALNDLSQVKPPAGLLRADERLIGPVFDEAGVRFFLVFNARLKVFHYILDETVPVADRLFEPLASVPIKIGRRTGFAFYRYDGREILIGVDERQSFLNTAYDGPFDQLPENFIAGEELREAIEAADPRARGKIDRLGHYADGKSRYLIHPYLPYAAPKDLLVFHRCVTARHVRAAERARCFVIADTQGQRRNPVPLPLLRR